MILLRQSLITEHHSVSSRSDPAREASQCSRYLRAARDVDATCTVGPNVHETMATKVRAHRPPNLLRGCVGRSDRRAPHVGLRNSGAEVNDISGHWSKPQSSRPIGLKRGIHRQDARSAKEFDQPAHIEWARSQRPVHLEHGVHHLLGNLLDRFLRLIHCVFPLRPSRLRGGRVKLAATNRHAGDVTQQLANRGE